MKERALLTFVAAVMAFALSYAVGALVTSLLADLGRGIR